MTAIISSSGDSHNNNLNRVSKMLTTTLQIAGSTLGILPDSTDPSILHLPTYSLEQVSWHDSADDCWVIIFDKIYDLGNFLKQHPGGEDVILENAGRDATLAFRSVCHSMDAIVLMEKYCIGVLVENERLYLRKKKSLFG